jgi:4-diphosphocytidyl-2-C-methyl-D-erythritol kinase
VRLRAFAKINLTLKILGKRPDGFHELESLMQSVSLCDYITLTPLESGIQLTTNNLRLPVDGRNLAYKAAEVFFRKQTAESRQPNTGVKIFLEKNIPLAAGLAGGSADAAAVLFGLNQLSGNPLSKIELMKLGEEIGSDVPFCLVGGNCKVGGRGEKVALNPLHVKRDFVLVTPEVEVSTKWAYEAWDEHQTSNVSAKGGSAGGGKLQNKSQNDLEDVVVKKYPTIQKVKDKLLSLGCSYAQMSGSGPSVFGIVGSAGSGQAIFNEMKKEFPRSFLVRSAERGVEEA